MKYKKGVLVLGDRNSEEIHIKHDNIVKPICGRVEYEEMLPDSVVRNSGNFAGLGVILNKAYDWEIVVDSQHALVLVALKK